MRTKKRQRNLKFFFRGLGAFWNLAKDFRHLLVFAFVMVVFIELLHLAVPLLIKLVLDEVPQALNGQIPDKHFFSLIALMLLTSIGAIYLDKCVSGKKFLKFIDHLENYIPEMIHKKLLSLPLRYHEKENTGKKISRIERGCLNTVDVLVHLRWNFLPPFLYMMLNVICITVIEWRLVPLFILPLIPVVWVNTKRMKNTVPVWDRCDTEKERATGKFCQSLSCIDTVQSYVQEKREAEEYSKIRRNISRAELDVAYKTQDYFFWTEAILKLFFVAIIALSIYLVFLGQTTIGTVVFAVTTSNMVFNSLQGMIQGYIQLSKKFVSVLKLNDLLMQKDDMADSPKAVVPKKYKGKFEFNNVTFSYLKEVEPVLRNINMKFNPGQMIALVGKTGEGKTTLLKLLRRAYDVNYGSIILDGLDIRKLNKNWYRRLFAVVHQNVEIFDTTIAQNIRYANPKANDQQLREAVKIACLNEVIDDKNKFVKGLGTEVGEHGVKLSGGQRQRIGIARAYITLLNGAKVLILDEATSSLDSKTERVIQRMIDEVRKNMSISIIAVAHRLSTIQNSDRIYLIEKGGIAKEGNHYDLYRTSKLYADMIRHQKIK